MFHLSRQRRMRCGSCGNEAPSPIPEVRHARHWKTVCRQPDMEHTRLRVRRTSRSTLRPEKLLELLGRSRDHRASAANYYRPLHQVRMLQQEADHRLLGGVVRGLQLQFVETLVLADQIGDRTVEHPDYLFES